jgi:hypothetical protein
MSRHHQTKEDRPMRAPTNTKAQDPMIHLMEAMIGGPSGAIERQEAQGQRELVASDTLPTDMGHSDGARQILEAAGVKFLGPVEGDSLFQYVALPDGWSKKPTDHSMWSHLVDAKGRVRASIFYKAAFYDRSAHLGLDSRYSVSFDYDRRDNSSEAVCNCMDGDTVIHSTEPVAMLAKNDWSAQDKANDAACAWMNKHFPEWDSPAAYWD